MKNIIITGGTSGIGLATAKLLLASNHHLILVGRSVGKFEAIKEELAALNSGSYEFMSCDLTNINEVKDLAENLTKKFPILHGLVNNAGIYKEMALDDVTEEEFDLLFNTNFKGSYFLTKYLKPSFTSGSSIVNISSDAGINGNYNCTTYCATKGALNLFTKALALEWAPYNIRVNAVCPGDIDTPLTREQFGANFNEEIKLTAQLYPLGRIGQPEEVAHVIELLLSEKSSFVTGAIWSVDGGLTSV